MSRTAAIAILLVLWSNLETVAHAQELRPKIEQYFNAQILKNGFRGQVLLVQGDEVLMNKSFPPPSGLGGDLNLAQDRFPVGAIAEQFIAAAILQLELAGHVKLDSPICDYISGCPDEWKQIQILHLLTHSSGLPSLHGFSPCGEHRASKSSTVIAMLSGKPLLFEPGNRSNLNSLDYFFLSIAIEKISGQSANEYLDEHIFHPLKLAQTGYLAAAPQEKVSGTEKQAGCSQAGFPENSGSYLILGELYSSIADLYRWNHALSTEKFLPKNSVNQMYTPYIEGYGFGSKILKEFGRKVAVQNDESDSNSVSIRLYPDDNTCIMVVSRVHQASASELSRELGALLFGKHPRNPSDSTATHN